MNSRFNPILATARLYHQEHQIMDDPVDWPHVLRKVEQALAGNFFPSTPPVKVDQALAVLSRLARLDTTDGR